MDTLLSKYYEYFLKSNEIRDDFWKFYSIIINRCDLNDKPDLKNDIDTFFELYEDYTLLLRKHLDKTTFYDNLIEKEIIQEIINDEGASFKAFPATPYMNAGEGFVYSINGVNGYFCKAYLSIKPEKYVSTLIKLQDFIDGLFRKYPDEEIGQCKFRDFPANDAIVMRFASEKHYKEFLKFLDENDDIKDCYDTPNLFMPQEEHGMCLISDNGGSYNYFVSKIIWDYMSYCYEKNINVSIDNLVNYINAYDYSNDYRFTRDGEDVLNDFKAILIGKLTSKSDKELLDIVFKRAKNKIKVKE